MGKDGCTEKLPNRDVQFCLHRCNSLHKTDNNLQERWEDVSEVGDRNLVNQLIDYSEADHDLVETIFCNDWKEATVGWQHTIPFVKYAWRESKKAAVTDGSHDKKKSKNRPKNKSHPDDLYWRCTVEPGTYRYSPGGFHRQMRDPYFVQRVINEKENEQIQQHIERVREHLEKTLKSANNPHYSAKLRNGSERQNRSNSDSAIQIMELYRPGSREMKKKLKHAELLKAFSSDVVRHTDEEKGDHVLPEYQVHKVEINNPFVDPYFDERLATHSPKFRFSHARNTDISSGLASSKENITIQRFNDHLQNLNPLLKVTPQQRQVKDDSDALLMSRDSTDLGGLSLEDIDRLTREEKAFHNMPSVGGDCSDPFTVQISNPCQSPFSAQNDRLRQIKFDFYSGLSCSRGSSNSSSETTKEFSLAKELQSVSQLMLTQKSVDPKFQFSKHKRSRPRPHKLRAMAQGSEDPNGRLGEPMHRGIIDRETASAMASELLPGVNGQRLQMPVNSQRIL